MSDRVAVTLENGVADVRLNRPDKLNALDPAMFAAIVEAGEALKTDPAVRAVVLSGEGRGFCAGLDFSVFQSMAGSSEGERSSADGASAARRKPSSGGDSERSEPAREMASAAGASDGASAARRKPSSGGDSERSERSEPARDTDIAATGGRETHLGQQAAWVWTEVPVPVIAAIHGPCLGGGFQIALGPDIRIVAPDAKLSVLEIRWGLTPDMTGTVMLPRLVGLDVAKELTFTGRMIDGEEAYRIGLATRLSDDPRDTALELAREIAAKSPHAVRGAKALLNQSGQRPVAEQFADERETIGRMIGSANQVEAVMAYFEKRDPVFRD